MLAQNVRSCGGHTRMTGTRNLSAPHTLLRRADPNAGAAKPASSTRDADSPFASQHMLAQNVRARQSCLFALSHAQ